MYVTTFLQLWNWNETTSWDLVFTKKLPAASAEASVEDSVEVQQQDDGLLLLDHLNLLHCRVWYHWISSTTGCHIRPMQTFSLLSFILESGWPCIHLDWGSKYDFRSQQKQLLIETSDGGEVQTGNDYRGDHCKNPIMDRKWKPPGFVERECWYCCVKERCRVNFVSLSNWKKWRSCRPGCKRFCNA